MSSSERNPDHPVTRAMRDQWHKIVAILLHRFGDPLDGRVVLSPADIASFQAGMAVTGGANVVIEERDDGLHVWLVGDDEAAKLADGGQG